MICEVYVSTVRALTRVGTIACIDPPRRGEVIVLHEAEPESVPDPERYVPPLPQMHYVVEQVVRHYANVSGGGPASVRRLEGELPNNRLYVSPLDEEGRVTPYERGRIPAVVIRDGVA